MTVTPSFIYHQRYQQPAPDIGRRVFFQDIGVSSWYKLCSINMNSTDYNYGKHISMELVGSSGYNVVNNQNKNFRIFMNFMSSNSSYYKNSDDTMNVVHGNIYADLVPYLLSQGGVGPTEIVLIEHSRSLYDIYIYIYIFILQVRVVR